MTDHFERLGLPRRFSVDAGELEREYLARSRAVHPDFHVGASAVELGASLELSAALNEAYNTLRDPFARADHLLVLEGGPAAGEHKQLPPAFLGEMLEARERVEAAAGRPDEVARLKAEFGDGLAGLVDRLAELFSRHEALPPADAERANLRVLARGLLNQAKYLRGLIRDLPDE